ncbi:helix-turn-helix transcriptional regulator [Actinoplanes solisilvae]|uniref:helix-turn-helix transcriptional regulator n=1 Tax=Actinoplanes solisilvae TaxID=2486853 RepID=UPI000FDC8368|nr:helix-turn-helix domain-containing protein [Actinoplanes solisilvae]
MTDSQSDDLWSIERTAQYLGIPVATLYQWRHRRTGPPGRRVGRYIRYDPAEVRDWYYRQAA